MSAEVKITANTRDAQQKIQKLKKEVDNLDKLAKKPKTINVKGNGKLGSAIGAAGSAIGAGAVAKGNLIADAIKGFLKQYIPSVARLSAGLLGKGFGLQELERAVTRITPKLRSLFDALDTFGNPGVEALDRADRIDALDDERRSHNSQSLAEEYAYSKAFSNIAGVNGSQLVDRVQSLLDMATSGSISEMDRAWKQLDGFGVTYEDIQKGSTWQVLQKMLTAYAAAGVDGENELEPNMQQIVGKRQMAAVRKIGDGSELAQQAAELTQEFNERIQNQQEILREAAQSEVTRAKADIQNMAIPEEGLHYINDEADNQLSTAELKTGMIGDVGKAGEAVKNMLSEVADLADPAIQEIKNKILNSLSPSNLLPSNLLPSWLAGGNTSTGNINVKNGNINVQEANPLAVQPPTEISTGGALTLLHNNATPVTPSLLEPADNVTLPKQEPIVTAMGSTQQPLTLPKAELDMSAAIRQLTTEIKNNTTASKSATDVMRNLQVRNTTTSGGNSDVTNIATFA